MLITARHLVDRLQFERLRADDLLALRRRLAALPEPSEVSGEERELAHELRRARERFSALLEGVSSCSSCAVGHPMPFGRYDGGHCCGGQTEKLFTDDELAALKLAGTTAGRLKAPKSELAGCVFRGATGCSLEARDRPTLCVRYLCRDLERELKSHPRREEISAVHRELAILSERFAELRASAELAETAELDFA